MVVQASHGCAKNSRLPARRHARQTATASNSCKSTHVNMQSNEELLDKAHWLHHSAAQRHHLGTILARHLGKSLTGHTQKQSSLLAILQTKACVCTTLAAIEPHPKWAACTSQQTAAVSLGKISAVQTSNAHHYGHLGTHCPGAHLRAPPACYLSATATLTPMCIWFWRIYQLFVLQRLLHTGSSSPPQPNSSSFGRMGDLSSITGAPTAPTCRPPTLAQGPTCVCISRTPSG